MRTTLWSAAAAAIEHSFRAYGSAQERWDMPMLIHNPFEGVLRFPQVIRSAGEERELVAWFSETTREIQANEFDTLQKVYGGSLEITNHLGKPLIRRPFHARSADHARAEGYAFAKQINKHLGVKLMMQPEELGARAPRA